MSSPEHTTDSSAFAATTLVSAETALEALKDTILKLTQLQPTGATGIDPNRLYMMQRGVKHLEEIIQVRRAQANASSSGRLWSWQYFTGQPSSKDDTGVEEETEMEDVAALLTKKLTDEKNARESGDTVWNIMRCAGQVNVQLKDIQDMMNKYRPEGASFSANASMA